MPRTGPFLGCFTFSPFDDMFLCLRLIFCNFTSYTQIGSPVPTWSVPTSHIGPVRGVRDSYGVILGLVYIFSSSMTCFQCFKSDFSQIIRRTL